MIKYLLFLIISVGFIIRFANITPFKIYPDSYQSLIVARNIVENQSVTGLLGKDGVFYPPYIIWSRPGYPLLIDTFAPLFKNAELTAQIISFAAGAFGIIVLFFLLRKLFKDDTIALSGSTLLALSFNHTIWGGFIMTETLGVLSVLTLLLLFYSNIYEETQPGKIIDILIGAFFGFCILVRYEYILLIIPFLFLIFTSKSHRTRFINFVAGLTVILALVFYFFFPPSTLQEVFFQLQSILQRTGVIVSLLLLLAIFTTLFFRSKRLKKNANLIPKLLICLLFFSLFILAFLYPAALAFAKNDPAIVIFFLVGSYLMLKNKEHRKLVYVSLLGCIVLLPIYHKINPLMERYFTHLLPFLLIPAAFGFSKVARYARKRPILILFLVVLISYQAYTSFWGLRTWNGGSWTRNNYFDRAALEVKKIATNEILLVSFPEPYYLAVGTSTQGIYNSPPFIHLDETYNKHTLLIVNDMGMRDLFPEFSNFLKENLNDLRIQTFKTGENYHYQARVEKEVYPIELYKITVGDLRERIKAKR